MVGELLFVACPLYRLLVRPLGVVEDLLIGGEEGEPPADLLRIQN